MRLEDAIKTSAFASEAHRAEVNLLYTSYQFKSNFSQALKLLDCTVEQYNVLRILKGSHPRKMCVKDIASRMIERSSNVPRIIDRLVAKNWVERAQSEEDKRETVVTLTDLGMKQLLECNGAMSATAKAQNKLSETEFATLNTLLDKWRG